MSDADTTLRFSKAHLADSGLMCQLASWHRWCVN